MKPKKGIRLLIQVWDRSKSGYDIPIKFNLSLVYCNEICAQLDGIPKLETYLQSVGEPKEPKSTQ